MRPLEIVEPGQQIHAGESLARLGVVRMALDDLADVPDRSLDVSARGGDEPDDSMAIMRVGVELEYPRREGLRLLQVLIDCSDPCPESCSIEGTRERQRSAGCFAIRVSSSALGRFGKLVSMPTSMNPLFLGERRTARGSGPPEIRTSGRGLSSSSRCPHCG